MEVILAEPRGFCAGVKRAVDILDLVLKKYGKKYQVYVLHEIVHNQCIIEDFKNKGVIFIDNVEDVKSNSVLVFSAHGISKAIEDRSKEKNVIVVDATCPLVSKVHREAQRHKNNGRELILIGHKGHPEIKGIIGRVNGNVILVENVEDAYNIKVNNENNLSYITQTTLSIDDTSRIISVLTSRFPNIIGPNLNDICYATQNRQNAVKQLSKIVDMILVIGSKNSSNSNRLLDLCVSEGKKAYLIDSYHDVRNDLFIGVEKLGITAGASAPDILIHQLINYLRESMEIKISNMPGIKEKVKFKIPQEL
ncbi:4-hydroxy-3-methylbut-2-enyl diphosphate reductase [Wolbachia endosymbiont of Pentidionis agamae]|uniref:4-hydroxy-3-methylbut-2-enyl diphosphate reductase n=1 Tax=Wolbachia endosymbiont of Pentidionis agamae TaxID=3110435 RepID=UPI002FD64020